MVQEGLLHPLGRAVREGRDLHGRVCHIRILVLHRWYGDPQHAVLHRWDLEQCCAARAAECLRKKQPRPSVRPSVRSELHRPQRLRPGSSVRQASGETYTVQLAAGSHLLVVVPTQLFKRALDPPNRVERHRAQPLPETCACALAALISSGHWSVSQSVSQSVIGLADRASERLVARRQASRPPTLHPRLPLRRSG